MANCTIRWGDGVFEMTPSEIAAFRWEILNSMMDDAEDIERIYLSINQPSFETQPGCLQPRFSLASLVDELWSLIQEGLIKAEYSNDEETAPLAKVEPARLHYYWFSPTEAGLHLWRSAPDRSAS